MRSPIAPSLVLLPAAFAALLAGPLRAQTTWTDVTDAAGLTHTHQTPASFMMGPMVGGGTVGDFNGDGWPDIFLLGGGITPDRLFINQGNGTFVDEAPAWGVDRVHLGASAAVGDYDGDGWQDLYVTSHGVDPVVAPGFSLLYHNEGNGTFTEVARIAGVAWTSLMGDAFDGAFGDYDLDGDLDLFVANYDLTSLGNRLFRNRGDGSFEEVTRESGIDARDVHGFTPGFADMDGDRWPELILIGDTGTSRYFVNNRDGTFTDASAQVSGLDIPNAMGQAVGDVNGDGLLDFYVSDAYWPLTGAGGNRLYINQGGHTYTEEGRSAGVYDVGWGWGVVCLDFDNDGLLDLAGTNGYPGVYENYPSKLFHNQGDGTFVEVGQATGLDHTLDGRCMLRLDYDRDGDEDLAIVSSNDPFKLFRNDLANGNHWIQLRLDTQGHPGIAPMGFGTRIELLAGGVEQVRFVDSGKSYLGQSEMKVHFGLGASAVADEIRILWPDGFRTVLRSVAADQELVIHAEPPLAVPPLQRGTTVDLVLSGLEPGQEAVFLASDEGAGPGPVLDKLGNAPLGILAPVRELGTALADAEGRAILSLSISATAQLRDLWIQAAGRTSAGETILSQVVQAPVLP